MKNTLTALLITLLLGLGYCSASQQVGITLTDTAYNLLVQYSDNNPEEYIMDVLLDKIEGVALSNLRSAYDTQIQDYTAQKNSEYMAEAQTLIEQIRGQ